MTDRRTVIHRLDISPNKIEFLKEKPSARESLIEKLKKKGFVTSFDLDQVLVKIEADMDTDTGEVLKFIDEHILEMEFQLGVELLPVMETIQFPFLDDEYLEVMVRTDKRRQSVKVVGFHDGVESFKQSINMSKDMVLKRQSLTKDYKEDETRRNFRADKMYERNKNSDGDFCACSRPTATVDPQESGMRKSTFYCKVGSVMDELRTQASNVGSMYNCDVQYTQIRSPRVTPKQARVSVVSGEIQTIKADAIISSTNPKLTLSMGKGLSSVILKAAGDGIQTELRTNYPNGLQNGEVAKSGPGNISTCKAIYHGVLPMFLKDQRNRDECCKALVMVVLNALLMASSDGYTSIAFPALGTGILCFPVEEAVQLLFLAVTKFFQCALSPIEKIFFVIYPKADPFFTQLFLMEAFSGQLHTVKVNDPTQVHEELHKDATQMYETRFEAGKTFLQISNGDVTDVCDVTKVVLILWRQDYVNQYKENPVVSCFDKSIQNHIYSKYAPLLNEKDTKFVVDKTSFQNTSLIHLYCKDDTDDVIARAIVRGIKQVEENMSIVIPIQSDGSRLWQPHVTVNIITKALQELKSQHNVIRVILQDSNQLVPFLTSMTDTSCKVKGVPSVINVFDTIFPLPVSHVSIGDVAITVTPLSKEPTQDFTKVVRELKRRLGIILMYQMKDT